MLIAIEMGANAKDRCQGITDLHNRHGPTDLDEIFAAFVGA